MSKPKTYRYHSCAVWEFSPGRKRDCHCYNNPLPEYRYSNQPPKPRPKPRYTFEEAAALIDRCAGCGEPIPEDSCFHHCELCLPAWLEHIKKIEEEQERAHARASEG